MGIGNWELGIGHPFPAGRYANGYAQGKWAMGTRERLTATSSSP
ncbi:hypothetical protein COO91_04971 [Nostoc flagelliforme CCNUN1]|uniref:Uncharacterized protein n=1 Tax=Nostoc flagelliforme CCNUN1 TaxID=2038116 RepID=A0A2K8SU59_9NOSO|nr:hypothetical protein COO91_04971 [Nostoc flagelliforme CCNUN1]